ncbi:hypothetical protein [Pararhizobium sp. A13]|uniref:hypothetical protein n=1 Tax=Pararhizobium sp. A13 TaxID=3133975 RepID=UPI00324999C0
MIGKTSGHRPGRLDVHGHIASVMAAMAASTAMGKRFEALKHNDYLQKLDAGFLATGQKRQKPPCISAWGLLF